MSDNPKPLTYGAAMRALEGSQAALTEAQAALTEALAELTTAVDELDSTRARLAFAQAALREETARAMTWKRVAKRVRQRANRNQSALWGTIRSQIDTIRQVVDERNAAVAREARLRATLQAAQALETFYISRAWVMYEDEASLWAAFAEARRAALETQP